IHHAYRHSVGPRLARHQALLLEFSGQVLTFWQAVQELCAWLAELSWAVRDRSPRPRTSPGRKPGLPDLFALEHPLDWLVREPHWTDSVRLTGVADSVLRIPGSDRWCVLELKLGRTSPEADLGQVCLYQQMLGAGRGAATPGTLTLVSFGPQRHERIF